jgi:nucleoside-diphosphate-sugar epimerase
VDVVIAGGHGRIGMKLGLFLAANGHRARGLIRNPAHSADLEADGIEAVVCDLEDEAADVAGAIEGADAVVFAAGAGPGSGPERKWTVDYGGAARLIAACKEAGVSRYAIVSSMGADNPPSGDDDVFAVYLQAKAKADRELAESGLDYTIVRPGHLTEDHGSGLIAAAESVERGEIPRDDVAATLFALLEEPGTIGVTFELVSGDTPIEEALEALGANS